MEIKSYTHKQEEAINSIDDNLRIIACAGSGKTQVISERIIKILQEKDIEPKSIIAFTFTEKAASELKNRILALAKAKIGNVRGMADMYIGTIHGWCFQALQKHHYEYQKFDVLDDIRLRLFVDRYFNKIGMGEIGSFKDPDRKLKRFSNTGIYIQLMNIIRESDPTPGEEIPVELREAVEKYELTLKEHFHLDFTMIIGETIKLLQSNAEFRNKISESLRYLVVDEYQDINPIQEKLIRELFSINDQINICVVGDDDQNIYHWRGSKLEYIQKFHENYPNVKSITISENFRSSKGVTDVAEHLIINNLENRISKEMNSKEFQKYEKDDIVFNEFKDDIEENEYIAKRIEQIRGTEFTDGPNKESRGLDYSDCCILLRRWSKAEKIIETLKKHGIPFITGGVNKLFETEEVKASIDIFNYIVGKIDKEELIDSWQNVNSEISSDSLYEAIDYLNSKIPEEDARFWDYCIQEIFWTFLHKIGLIEEMFSQENVDFIENTNAEIIYYNLGKFSQVINDYDAINRKTGNVQYYFYNFLNFIKYAAADYYPEGWINNTYKTPNAVQIMTIHQAKGLEFPIVFIPGLNRNYLPSQKIGGLSEWHFLDEDVIEDSQRYKGGNDEEERRLFYVAITRAQKYLHISRAPVTGKRLYNKPSKFIDEISSSEYIIGDVPSYTEKSKKPPRSKKDTQNIVLNFSILKDFFDCGYRFKLVSIYGFCTPLDIRMGYGQSLHNALTEIHKKGMTGESIEETDAEKYVDRHLSLPYASPTIVKEEKAKILKRVEKYIRKNKDTFSEIEFVEQDIQLDIGSGILVTGRIDLVKEKQLDGSYETTIFEFKSKSSVQSPEMTYDQLCLYGLGHEELTGNKADYLRIYDLEKNVPDVKRPLKNEDLEGIKDKIKKCVQNIRSNDFHRVNQWDKCKTCHYNLLCSGYSTSKPSKS